MLSVGLKAPDFTLVDEKNNKVSLSDFLGKKVILYFYPKDNTSGCTKEACSFKKEYHKISSLNTVVIGISKDSPKSHEKFIKAYDLPFVLLSDESHVVIELYEAWQEKKMYGRSYMGTARITYIIDEKGYIIKTFSKVKLENHALEIVEYLG